MASGSTHHSGEPGFAKICTLYNESTLREASNIGSWLDQLTEANTGGDFCDSTFADSLDEHDPIKSFRQKFHIPMNQSNDKQAIYLCGNSLGLQPKATGAVVQGEMNKWAQRGVDGHFEGDIPWATCEELLPELCKDLIGAADAKLEIAFTSSLTVNLHMLMAAFYQPKGDRNKILIEAAAFPSDRYATSSQILHHGLKPEDCLIEVSYAEGVVPNVDNYGVIPTERILKTIDENKDTLALVLLSGIQYLTGQFFDIPRITAHVAEINKTLPKGQRIYIGWDLAHAAGNVPLHMNEWGADFAAFCTYKYINSGAGCLSGIFIHEKHAHKTMEELPRLAGWWGVPFANRFKMGQQFQCAPGAPGFLCSNTPPLLVACVKPSLEVFAAAGGMTALRRKSFLLTGYFERLLKSMKLTQDTADEGSKRVIDIVTPGLLEAKGVIGDTREPDIVRISPAPLYNSFRDVFDFVTTLKAALNE